MPKVENLKQEPRIEEVPKVQNTERILDPRYLLLDSECRNTGIMERWNNDKVPKDKEQSRKPFSLAETQSSQRENK
jgi:hypothetical protein